MPWIAVVLRSKKKLEAAPRKKALRMVIWGPCLKAHGYLQVRL